MPAHEREPNLALSLHPPTHRTGSLSNSVEVLPTLPDEHWERRKRFPHRSEENSCRCPHPTPGYVHQFFSDRRDSFPSVFPFFFAARAIVDFEIADFCELMVSHAFFVSLSSVSMHGFRRTARKESLSFRFMGEEVIDGNALQMNGPGRFIFQQISCYIPFFPNFQRQQFRPRTLAESSVTFSSSSFVLKVQVLYIRMPPASGQGQISAIILRCLCQQISTFLRVHSSIATGSLRNIPSPEQGNAGENYIKKDGKAEKSAGSLLVTTTSGCPPLRKIFRQNL